MPTHFETAFLIIIYVTYGKFFLRTGDQRYESQNLLDYAVVLQTEVAIKIHK